MDSLVYLVNIQRLSYIYESGLKRLFVAKLFVVKNFSILINNELTAVVKFPPPRFWRKSTFLDSTHLSFAELQARQRKPMYMADWIKKLHDFLTLNDREILEHAGKISAKIAKELAEGEYEKYRQKQIDIEDIIEIKALEEGIKKLQKGDKNGR